MLSGYGWPMANLMYPQYEQYAQAGRWKDALTMIRAALNQPAARVPVLRLDVTILTIPWLALAEAKTGDTKSAWRDIATTPLDCYLCLDVRGQIAQIQRDWNDASTWFGRAVKLAPSIPSAYADWGGMLMARGDLDGAIAKFASANRRGPHFADPLEMWGEALIRKNRSDLALAKFEEASKDAPNWGRLHLKWGEALLWSGDKDGARKQFQMAATLDLTASEKAELAQMRGAHG
jgi:tetratricopeptide (TPR) repeat protein